MHQHHTHIHALECAIESLMINFCLQRTMIKTEIEKVKMDQDQKVALEDKLINMIKESESRITKAVNWISLVQRDLEHAPEIKPVKQIIKMETLGADKVINDLQKIHDKLEAVRNEKKEFNDAILFWKNFFNAKDQPAPNFASGGIPTKESADEPVINQQKKNHSLDAIEYFLSHLQNSQHGMKKRSLHIPSHSLLNIMDKTTEGLMLALEKRIQQCKDEKINAWNEYNEKMIITGGTASFTPEQYLNDARLKCAEMDEKISVYRTLKSFMS